MRRLAVVAACVVASSVAAAGCRDAPEPFEPAGRTVGDGTAWRLTASPGDDRSPSWSPDGSRILYAAEGFGALSGSSGVLLEVPFRSGTATPLLAGTGGSVRPHLSAPAAAPDGGRIAYVHRLSLFPATLCGENALLLGCEPLPGDGEGRPLPRLAAVAVRARDDGAGGPVSDDPGVRIDLPGRTFVEEEGLPQGLSGAWRIRYHPFHRVEREEGVRFYRPTWSPDGGRIATSDGLRILVWDVGAAAELRPVPGTDDGISPAWSPDGARIAFTRLERGDPVVRYCEHGIPDPQGGPPLLSCAERRTDWPLAGRTVVTVAPDGTGLRELGGGSEPAWSPDGGRLYFRRDGRIWSRPSGTGGAEDAPVPGTEGGREPAVSPDGRYLAFARATGTGGHDLWIVDLEAAR